MASNKSSSSSNGSDHGAVPGKAQKGTKVSELVSNYGGKKPMGAQSETSEKVAKKSKGMH